MALPFGDSHACPAVHPLRGVGYIPVDVLQSTEVMQKGYPYGVVQNSRSTWCYAWTTQTARQ